MIDIQINRIYNTVENSKIVKIYCEKIVVKIFGITVFIKVVIPDVFC
jgi:hypothetical protein